jgi:phosphotransacetylase
MPNCWQNCSKKKGMTIEEARQKVEDPLYLGCLIVKSGAADGQLAGARNTTGNVLRPSTADYQNGARHHLRKWRHVAHHQS